VAFGAAALAAPSVAAANPVCGATIKHNIKLTGNLDCSGFSGNGLNVGKAGITINLGGFTLTGPSGSHDGINNEGGYDKVTVENGTVKDYEYGVLYEYTTGSKILHVKSVDASYDGIGFWYSHNGVIDHSRVSGSGEYGFYLYENNHVNLTNSHAVHVSTYGVYDYYSLSTLNNVTANSGSEYGVYIDDPIAAYTSKGFVYYTIENSTANQNSSDGFYIAGNYPTIYYQANLVNNTANNNMSYGFYADDNTKGKRNHATGNGTNCWHVPCG
jgi:hypothetical protein